MNELQSLKYEENFVRVIEKEDGLWWVLADVCKVIGLNTSKLKQVADRLDDDEKGRYQIPTPGGPQESWIVNEPGLYNVILRSDKPEAKAFKRWVTHEVLPAIRKHGVYATAETAERLMNDPDFMIKTFTALKEERERSNRLRTLAAMQVVELNMLEPKAEYFDALVEKNLLCSIRETAKLLNVPEKAFTQWLVLKHYLYRSKGGKLLPYADCESGLFAVKECGDPNKKWHGPMTFITPKGRETFRLLLQKGVERLLR